MPAGHATRRSAGDLWLRNWQNLRRSSLSATAFELLTYSRGACRAGPRRACLPRLPRLLRPRSWYGSAEDDSVDLAYHLLLHDQVLFDGHVPDARHVLHVHILELALELSGFLNRRAGAVGDVEVYIASHASREAGAEDRIQADGELNR